MNVMENGVACSPDNPALNALIASVKQASLALPTSIGTIVSGAAGEVEAGIPKIGRKLPGTSARFAPGGQAVVWGQSGIAPHAKDERHYIPSIAPYYNSLSELGKLRK